MLSTNRKLTHTNEPYRFTSVYFEKQQFCWNCLGFHFLSFIFYVFFTTKLVFGKAWLAFSCSTANRFNTTSWHSCLAFAYPGRFLYDATELLKPSVPGATFSFKIFAAVQLFLPTAGHVTGQLPHWHLEHLGIKETRNVTSVSVTFRLCYWCVVAHCRTSLIVWFVANSRYCIDWYLCILLLVSEHFVNCNLFIT